MLQETKGGTTLSYVPGISQHDPSQATEPARWAYFHGDAQNNRLLTDGSGAVSHRWEYEPFGNVRDESGPARSEFGYADEQRDRETGLVNLRARYYEPGLGRFLSRDAFGGLDADPQGWNRYSYVENNPVTGTDPSGHYGRGLPKAQVRALGREFAAGRFSEQNLGLIRRLTKDQYRQITGRLSNGVRKRLDRIAEPNEKEDDSKRDRLRKSCRNPGQYTGSCPGGPPNPAYVADQLAAEQAKILGRALQRLREAADNQTPEVDGGGVVHEGRSGSLGVVACGSGYRGDACAQISEEDNEEAFENCLDLASLYTCLGFRPSPGPGATSTIGVGMIKDIGPPGGDDAARRSTGSGAAGGSGRLSIDDVFKRPYRLLLGKEPEDVVELFDEAALRGWDVGPLGAGSLTDRCIVI